MRLICFLQLVFAFAAVGHAKPITFIFEAHISGESNSFGGSFSSIVLTATGDTSDRVVEHYGPSVWSYIEPETASFELTGLGTGQFDPRAIEVVGSGTTNPGQFIMMFYIEETYALTYAPLAFWDWETSVGPIIGTGGINNSWLPWADSHVYAFFPITFTAIVTPEPTSLAFLCLGSLCLPRRR